MSASIASSPAQSRRPMSQAVHSTTKTATRELPCRAIRSQIWEAAKYLALHDTGAREISAVLANRFHMAESAVDRILVLAGAAEERRATSYAVGLRNTAAMEEEAAGAVWSEVA